MICPYEGGKFRISQAFTLGKHNGLDLVGESSKNIIAVCGGTVTRASFHESMGNYVKIKQDDGLYMTYMHMSKILVSVGQRVSANQRIGVEGSTGYSTGSHLHIQCETQGEWIHTGNNASVKDIAAYIKVPNVAGPTILDANPAEDLSKEETSIMITNAIRANNKEFLNTTVTDLLNKIKKEKVYHYGTELPKWAQDDIKYVMDQKVFSGAAPNDLALTESQMKILCWIARFMKKISD